MPSRINFCADPFETPRRWYCRHVRPLALSSLVVLVTASGCASNGQSTLRPSGPGAEVAATSWWILLGVATFVCVLVIAAAVAAPLVRRRARKVRGGDARGLVLTLGVVLPSLVFAGAFALSVVGLQRTSAPQQDPAATVEVIGHTWWWEVRYAGTDAVTANEIHVPVGEPVRLRLRSADVIHSFWVPELMPKTDLLPGRVNDTWMTADRPGRFRGQCAEYCGEQHAHMAFEVVAQPRAEYDAWLARQGEDAAAPTTAEERAGMDVFTTSSCATCHTVRGTSADGEVGPDLTHLALRSRIGAGALPNDRGHLSGWVANSQTVKPGNLMPPQPLSPDDLRAVVTYLEGLD